jgi:peroxiredoxin
VLCDTEREVIAAYGLLHRGGRGESDIAIPANILIDRNGKIVWRFKADRVPARPDPGQVLEQVRALAKTN